MLGRGFILAALTFGLVAGISKESEPLPPGEDKPPSTVAVSAPPPRPIAPPEQAVKKSNDSTGAADAIVLLTALFVAGSDVADAAALVDRAR